MDEFDLVVGLHSIKCALQNKSRNFYKLVGTEESLADLKQEIKSSQVEVQMVSSHKAQEEAKVYFKKRGLEYHRVPGNCFLVCSALEVLDVAKLYAEVKPGLRILALDQISDVHNAGAILRTASFYNIDFVIIPQRNSFGLTPSFFRIASGATEYVKLVETTKLTRTLTKLKELGCSTIALSEHAEGDLESVLSDVSRSLVLVLGKEDTGISNAVLRVCDHKMSLESQGSIKSLNVSIASAIAMEKCFRKR